MKNLYILITALFIMLTSCKSDWLDVKPTGELPEETIFKTTANAYTALNGLNRLTVKQYQSSGYNGEGTIKLWYGEYMGNNFVKDFVSKYSALMNNSFLNSKESTYDWYPWFYYYKLIGDANNIILNIDNAEGEIKDKNEIKARALCYRAYSYFMLSQIYCKRWYDSNEGATSGLILRLNPHEGDNASVSTLKEVYKRIYDDLDEAINYFTTNQITRKYNFDMNIDVAKAIYARAALTKGDYEIAAKMASEVKSQYPLMNNNEMLSGFYKPNEEWIWSSPGGINQNLFFHSYQAYMAYNTTNSDVRNYPNCITLELYKKIPATDIRRNWWLYYEKLPLGQIKDKKIVSDVFRKYPKLNKAALIWNYMQFKIACEMTPGIGHLVHFRSSEMYLIEAEALARINKDVDAQKVMNDLNKNSGRDPQYNCTKTGASLIDEILSYRAIELWGEGFDWFDMKRTSREIKRSRRRNKGSFLDAVAITIKLESNGGWVWTIPKLEKDYNFDIVTNDE